MGWLDIPRVEQPEEIDNPDHDYADLAQSMADLARSNALFGGIDSVLAPARRLIVSAPARRRIRVLDIATGSGDIPIALARWANSRGIEIEIVATDIMPAMLRMAAERVAAARLTGQIELVHADALALPFGARSFDIALCALTLHHLGFDRAVAVLRAMDQVSARGFVATDLRRDRLSRAAVAAGLALIRAHPFTRHDGPASVERAYTPREYARMIALSGVSGIRLYSHFWFRMVMVRNKAAKVGI